MLLKSKKSKFETVSTIIKYYTSILCLLFILSSCGIYSFQQGSIPPEVQSISIANIYNESGGGPSNLSQNFTEKLKSYYQQNSRLSIATTNGDWQLEGKIVSYQVMPIAVQGAKGAANRLTMRVQIKFINNNDPKANFDQAFSFFSDYPAEQTLTLVENELIETITNQIVFDIFTKTTSNW